MSADETDGEDPVDSYGVNVYFLDDNGCWCLRGTWVGNAAHDREARRKALDAIEDLLIDGWKAEIAWRPTTPA